MRNHKKVELNKKLLQFASPKGGDNSVLNFHFRVMELTVYGNLKIPNKYGKYLSLSIDNF